METARQQPRTLIEFGVQLRVEVWSGLLTPTRESSMEPSSVAKIIEITIQWLQQFFG